MDGYIANDTGVIDIQIEYGSDTVDFVTIPPKFVGGALLPLTALPLPAAPPAFDTQNLKIYGLGAI